MSRFPRLRSFPQDPLARFRLLAMCLAVTAAFINVVLVLRRVEYIQTFRFEAAAAAFALGIWWLVCYRRGSFPVWGWLVDFGLLTIIGAQTLSPPGAIGLFFLGVQLRALFVRRRKFFLLVLAYGGARLLSGSFVPGTLTYGTLALPALLQGTGLCLIAFTLRLFVIGAERQRELEEQLRQSQKMEAVGQLAGGVAHDFNNLLTVIGGHVFMLEHLVPITADSRKHLDGITRAAERAALLTRQLLAFSRKQLLSAAVISVNDVVDDVLQMIRPVIGEQVQIVTRLEADLSPVFADAGQLGQVLVNLALNARDAMPAGGTLTIQTSNAALTPGAPELAGASLAPGRYVKLLMRDTGVGMDAQTLAHAFEPFFTTKPHGQGTGLGLATVYGIVRQSFGDIVATSKPGEGSEFTILLPVATGSIPSKPATAPAPADLGDSAAPRRVLLVEDDDGVREFAEQVLSRAGYRVQSARNGADALQQVGTTDLDSFDVVVTDVVMPEMGGRALIEQLRRQRPDLPAVYITGYTDDSRMIGALYAPETRLLEKPFTAVALAAAVEDVSEGSRSPVG
jgi:signal transduction histidine kinase/CheY-like chemotaxis protein